MDRAASTATPADTIIDITTRTPRTVRTQSGSTYRIEGTTVRKLTGEQPPPAFQLIDIRQNRLRYTDGSQLFISSPLVAA